MEGFEVTTELIQTTGDSVGATGQILNAEIAQMSVLLTDLQLSWSSSEAAPKFAASMESHLANATILKDALISHGTTLVTAGVTIAGSESALGDAVPVVSS